MCCGFHELPVLWWKLSFLERRLTGPLSLNYTVGQTGEPPLVLGLRILIDWIKESASHLHWGRPTAIPTSLASLKHMPEKVPGVSALSSWRERFWTFPLQIPLNWTLVGICMLYRQSCFMSSVKRQHDVTQGCTPETSITYAGQVVCRSSFQVVTAEIVVVAP